MARAGGVVALHLEQALLVAKAQPRKLRVAQAGLVARVELLQECMVFWFSA